jgi:Mn2+/Fe2+ NRAMP family transporter
VLVAGTAAAAVLVPGVPLVPLLVLTQVLNALLLLPLLVLMYRLSRDDEVMGTHVPSGTSAVYLVAIGFIAVCVAALVVLTVV